MLNDIVEYYDGVNAIIRSDRVFATGWNCYKVDGDVLVKMNPQYQCFASFESANEWLMENK